MVAMALRVEETIRACHFFEGEKVDIDHENTYPWEEIATISMF